MIKEWVPPWDDDDDDRAKPYETPRKVGRPRAGSTKAERIKHIKATCLLMIAGYPAAGVAAAHDVTERTIYRWRDLALSYTDPEADALREIAGKP